MNDTRVAKWIVRVEVDQGRYHVFPMREGGGQWIQSWRFGATRTRRDRTLQRLLVKCQECVNDLNRRDAVVAEARRQLPK